MSGTLGLYVHVPFCRTRCRYCDFYRVGENRARRERFLAALAGELDGCREWHGRPVETVFFGGGTPSLLEPDETCEAASAASRPRARSSGSSGCWRWTRPFGTPGSSR